MQKVLPILRITDFARSKAFYLDALGFQIKWEHQEAPQLPVFLQITRDGLSLFLSQHSGDCQPGGAVYLYVDDVDAWYEAIKSKPVRIEQAPADQSPDLRDMCVVDPDGNRICIGTLKQS